MTMTKINRCPFCPPGEDDLFVSAAVRPYSNPLDLKAVHCRTCGCFGPREVREVDAIAAWNAAERKEGIYGQEGAEERPVASSRASVIQKWAWNKGMGRPVLLVDVVEVVDKPVVALPIVYLESNGVAVDENSSRIVNFVTDWEELREITVYEVKKLRK